MKLVAELGANVTSLEIGYKSIDAAKNAGANAVKLQTYKATSLVVPVESLKIKSTIWAGDNLYNLYSKASVPWEWQRELFAYAASQNIEIFSSPFCLESLEFLENLNCQIYKIASFEINHIPLLKEIANTKKEVILSLGVATIEEIENALNILQNNAVTLLLCTSDYPSNSANANLVRLLQIASAFGKPYGLSDHSMDNLTSIIATSYGASVIEKHFKLDGITSPDSSFSLNPTEFASLCNDINRAKSAVGGVVLEIQNCENKEMLKATNLNLNLKIEAKERKLSENVEFKRSIWIKNEIKKGEIIKAEDLAVLRPNLGANPLLFDEIISKRAKKDLKPHTPLKMSDF